LDQALAESHHVFWLLVGIAQETQFVLDENGVIIRRWLPRLGRHPWIRITQQILTTRGFPEIYKENETYEVTCAYVDSNVLFKAYKETEVPTKLEIILFLG